MTVANYVRAEPDTMIRATMKMTGIPIGSFTHLREPTTPDNQPVIRIVIAAEQPSGAPEENWLPIERGDYNIDPLRRLYVPDLEKIATWTPPVARILEAE